MRPPKIYIDFVPGSHGHYLEFMCNAGFGFTDSAPTFRFNGTSHRKSEEYIESRRFEARHWYQVESDLVDKTVISIRFTEDDLLLLSSVSLLRSGDYNIDCDTLEYNTRETLKNTHYSHLLNEIQQSYPFLDQRVSSIPRYVLREFFKFGFKTPSDHGLMVEQRRMMYPDSAFVVPFDFGAFYSVDKFSQAMAALAKSLQMPLCLPPNFNIIHQKFLGQIPFTHHKEKCDAVINDVINEVVSPIPKLSLFQESYINGVLENQFNREMPFHQENYFNSTEDVLYYINNIAKPL